MGRKKIKIKTIENDRQKTVTFTRRRSGLIKKAHELAVLCDCKVVLLMFDARDACHMYSSEDDPEELIHKYYHKEFNTVEGKRKGSKARPEDRDARSTVVNEYRITTNGEGSENIQVKQVRNLHNPGSILLPLEQPVVGSSQPFMPLPPAIPTLEDYSIIPVEHEDNYHHTDPGYLNQFGEARPLLEYPATESEPYGEMKYFYQIPTTRPSLYEANSYQSHPPF
ncbi:SRF-like protein [Basidiobolus meristosporus CBS 931.73]|uniref:SRF-like protein n=1 Tax=Basidiobolus meristosporus CBS 931.73 TaxID=1314790 RepID=A0A1Y1YN17_9FUNG|nr:SRF-like protein [Basidiobolus meristosporus CBS 931.73]|eukprot:ORX99365.1 SRF-like protein [Basidiobolus meristosporus CBS 931.73]